MLFGTWLLEGGNFASLNSRPPGQERQLMHIIFDNDALNEALSSLIKASKTTLKEGTRSARDTAITAGHATAPLPKKVAHAGKCMFTKAVKALVQLDNKLNDKTPEEITS